MLRQAPVRFRRSVAATSRWPTIRAALVATTAAFVLTAPAVARPDPVEALTRPGAVPAQEPAQDDVTATSVMVRLCVEPSGQLTVLPPGSSCPEPATVIDVPCNVA